MAKKKKEADMDEEKSALVGDRVYLANTELQMMACVAALELGVEKARDIFSGMNREKIVGRFKSEYERARGYTFSVLDHYYGMDFLRGTVTAVRKDGFFVVVAPLEKSSTREIERFMEEKGIKRSCASEHGMRVVEEDEEYACVIDYL